MIALLLAGAVLGASASDGVGEAQGRRVAVYFNETPPSVETYGRRTFHVLPDQGDPRSRLEWTAFNCAGAVLAQTWPWDPRWTSGAHSLSADGALGPREGAGLTGPLTDAEAILPGHTARFTITLRDADGAVSARHGPFDLPGVSCS